MEFGRSKERDNEGTESSEEKRRGAREGRKKKNLEGEERGGKWRKREKSFSSRKERGKVWVRVLEVVKWI